MHGSGLLRASRADGGYRPLLAGVDVQLEHVRPRVVAGHVEVVLAAQDLIGVDVGVQDRFGGKVRTRQHFAQGIDDGAAAAHQHGVRAVAQRAFEVFRIRVAAQVLAGGQHIAAAFQRNVAHAGDPAVAGVRRRRAIQGDALAVHVHAQHRHVVFPADDGADLSARMPASA
ncbi:hypothetical protein G6F65_016452 [Rhizopus arrhizus]|nr:hypothetical protein G6F65_016452 [Rhizopus arrhizus]